MSRIQPAESCDWITRVSCLRTGSPLTHSKMAAPRWLQDTTNASMTVGAPLGEEITQLPMPWGLNHLLLRFLAVSASGFKPCRHPAVSQLSFQKWQPKCPPRGTCPHTYYKKLLLHKNHSPLCSIFCLLLLNVMTFLVELFFFLPTGNLSNLANDTKSYGTLEGKNVESVLDWLWKEDRSVYQYHTGISSISNIPGSVSTWVHV